MSVSIERGYELRVTPTGLELYAGGPAAAWALPSLVAALNDGAAHFLVADFSNEGGGTWRLLTSLDGAPFEDQGTASGPAVAAADTAPSISLSDTESDTWADEVAMWVNHSEFSDEHLANMHALGDAHGRPLSEYSEQFPSTTTSPPTTTAPPTTVPPTTTTTTTTAPPTTVPPTTTTGPVPHPADTNSDFAMPSSDVLPYANAYLTDDDSKFPGISPQNRTAYVLRAAWIFLNSVTYEYEDVGTSAPVDSQTHPQRWQLAGL